MYRKLESNVNSLFNFVSNIKKFLAFFFDPCCSVSELATSWRDFSNHHFDYGCYHFVSY